MTPIGTEIDQVIPPWTEKTDVSPACTGLGKRGEAEKAIVAEAGRALTEMVNRFVALAAKVNDWQVGNHTPWAVEKTSIWPSESGKIVRVVTGKVDDQHFYLPVVSVTRKGEKSGRISGVILPDGHFHAIKISDCNSGLIETRSWPDSQGNCYPLIPGIERVNLSAEQGALRIGLEIEINRKLVVFTIDQIETAVWDADLTVITTKKSFEKIARARAEKLTEWRNKLEKTLEGRGHLSS